MYNAVPYESDSSSSVSSEGSQRGLLNRHIANAPFAIESYEDAPSLSDQEGGEKASVSSSLTQRESPSSSSSSSNSSAHTEPNDSMSSDEGYESPEARPVSVCFGNVNTDMESNPDSSGMHAPGDVHAVPIDDASLSDSSDDDDEEDHVEESFRCRICLDESGTLIQPCACNSRVHVQCLNRWRQNHPASDPRRSACEICRTPFTIVDTSVQLRTWKQLSVLTVMSCAVANVVAVGLYVAEETHKDNSASSSWDWIIPSCMSAFSTATAMVRGWIVKQAYPDMPLAVLWCSRVDPFYIWKIGFTFCAYVFSPVIASLMASYFLHTDMSKRERLAEEQYTTPPTVLDFSMVDSTTLPVRSTPVGTITLSVPPTGSGDDDNGDNEVMV